MHTTDIPRQGLVIIWMGYESLDTFVWYFFLIPYNTFNYIELWLKNECKTRNCQENIVLFYEWKFVKLHVVCNILIITSWKRVKFHFRLYLNKIKLNVICQQIALLWILITLNMNKSNKMQLFVWNYIFNLTNIENL